MKSRALIMLFFALILGGLSVFMARQWVQSNSGGSVAEQPGMELTTVVVARVPLYFGNQLSRENLQEVQWPRATVPPGVFPSVEELLKDGQNRVALQTIEANEPVLAYKVSGLGGRATLSSVITDGMRAVTIRVNDVNGVAGFVLPGDRVDVMITREESQQQPVTDILLQNVKVLGIDQDASEKKDKPQVARAVTLEVTPEQAQKLTLGGTVGTLSLSLRNLANVDPASLRTITLKDLRVGEVMKDSQPVVAVQAPRKSTSVRSSGGGEGGSVRIVRGINSTVVSVKPDAGGPGGVPLSSLRPDGAAHSMSEVARTAPISLSP
ncbi:MAG TPA: Flp pilus assembly protein CpaB [Azospirillaceae bacterium]|nr:Flp pilus assembly protein CpaB [Azospirillaceae bacterium]